MLGVATVDPIVTYHAAGTGRLTRVDQGHVFAAQTAVVDVIEFDDVPRQPAIVEDGIPAIEQRTVANTTAVFGGLLLIGCDGEQRVLQRTVPAEVVHQTVFDQVSATDDSQGTARSPSEAAACHLVVVAENRRRGLVKLVRFRIAGPSGHVGISHVAIVDLQVTAVVEIERAAR